MHHAGIGYINDGCLFLPDDLLKPLTITHDSLLFGLYYSPPQNNSIEYKDIELKDDFVITPVPVRLWPKIGRLTIRLKHKPAMMKIISEFISKRKISILLTESTRSGHRYATWSLTVAFDYLDIDKLSFDVKKSLYIETFRELEKLKKALLTNCADALFIDPNDYHLKNPIIAQPDTTLSYFYQQSIERSSKSNEEGWLYEAFKLKCDNGVIKPTQGEKFEAILDHVSQSADRDKPKCVFATMNTNDMDIRVVVIPPEKNQKFFLVSFDYIRSGPPDTSRGVISYITQQLSNNYNIWKLYTRSKVSTYDRERGSTTLLLEDQSSQKETESYYMSKIDTLIQKICSQKLPEYLKQITSLKAEIFPFSALTIQDTIEQQTAKGRKYKHDVFISYSHINEKQAENIKRHLDGSGLKSFLAVELASGERFSDRIRQALIDSMEVCLLFTPESAKSDWVKTEWGATWALGKRLVPILYRQNITDLPEELKKLQVIDYHEIDKYVQEVLARRDLSLTSQLQLIM